MDRDQLLYSQALGRMARTMAVLGVGGTAVAWILGGWLWGGGFLAGAVASYLNFRWLKQIVEALGGGRQPRARTAVLAGLRYVLLAAGAYVILNFSALSLRAALAGLFVSVAAVIFEILFELLYAGT